VIKYIGLSFCVGYTHLYKQIWSGTTDRLYELSSAKMLVA